MDSPATTPAQAIDAVYALVLDGEATQARDAAQAILLVDQAEAVLESAGLLS